MGFLVGAKGFSLTHAIGIRVVILVINLTAILASLQASDALK